MFSYKNLNFSRLKDESGLFTVLFKPLEVGTFVMDIYVAGQKIPECPLFFKVHSL